MKTSKLLKESITEDRDAGIKKEEPSKDSHMHDADVEEKKSITEEDSAAFAAEKLGTMATEPAPLPCNEK